MNNRLVMFVEDCKDWKSTVVISNERSFDTLSLIEPASINRNKENNQSYNKEQRKKPVSTYSNIKIISCNCIVENRLKFAIAS